MIPGIPPHLMAPVLLLVVILWIMLVHHFKRSPAVQRFVAETIGDDTPDDALAAYAAARLRLVRHLHRSDLNADTRRRIEDALGNEE